MTTYKRLPVAFESGQGVWLYDQNGQAFLDALGGIAVCGLGHAHPAVTEAIGRQAGLLLHTSNLYEIPLQEALGDKLCGLSGLGKVFFGNSGAEANEAAIKLCRLYGNKKGFNEPVIIVMDGSFHGRTLATLSATGNPKVKEGFGPLVPGFHQIAYNDVDALKELETKGMEIVAVMLEPVQGEGGIIIPDPGYLKTVRDICTENGWLMVLDEIQTGMCRTGEWFAWQHEPLKPDIMTLAKSLGNGVPVGACIATDEVAGIMLPGGHGSTFGGNPLVASASLAVVEYMESHQFPERAAVLGDMMLARFRRELEGVRDVKDIRGKGLMIGIELSQDCAELVAHALEQHLLINVTAGNVVRLLPPLVTSDDEAEQMVVKTSTLIREFVAA